MFKLMILISTFIAIPLFAHEGHHHTPATVAPPKGGVLRTLETIHLEMLQQGKKVKVYVYDKKLKPLQAKSYKASALAFRPRKRAEKIELKEMGDHWEYQYDARGAHRYTFELDIEQGGHKDKVKWNIEPKR